MTTSEDDSPVERQFTLFPKLCPELRHEIIQLALYQPRVVEISMDLNSVPRRLNTGIPALFHVNRETRHQAIKVFGLERQKDEDGSFELESQMLINYATDTLLVSDERRMHDLLGLDVWRKVQSVAINESLWYAERSWGLSFPQFGHWIDYDKGFCQHLKEFVILRIPRTLRSQDPCGSGRGKEEKAKFGYESTLRRRIWARDIRGKVEVEQLWQDMEHWTQDHLNILGRGWKLDGWASEKEDVQSGLRGSHWYRRNKLMADVKAVRGVVDEQSIRGGNVVFEKEI